MATVRISQLTAITAPTDDDVFIINDADTNTRKITYANLVQGLINTSATPQTKTGSLTVAGTLTAGSSFVAGTNTLFVDAINGRVGVRNTNPQSELDVSGDVRIRSGRELRLGDANDSNYVALRSTSSVASNFSLTLPGALPLTSAVVTADSAGNLGFSQGVTLGPGSLSLNVLELLNEGELRLFEGQGSGSDYISIKAPASLNTTLSYTLPAALPGTTGFVLSSDTSGNLSWVSNAAGAAGIDNSIQYNISGVLNSSPNFTFQASNNLLTTVNATFTGNVSVLGNTTLGDANTDTITLNGRLTSNLVPQTDSVLTVGTSSLKFSESHVTTGFVYGTLNVLGTVQTDLLPSSGAESLGGAGDNWAAVYADETYVGDIVKTHAHSINTLSSASVFVIVLGDETTWGSHKALVHVRDAVTGETELYEYFVTQDGAGNVSEITGMNVQSTPGTFLTTAAASQSSGDIILTITNSAIATNDVDVRVQVTSIIA
jgi:hypothetical protein